LEYQSILKSADAMAWIGDTSLGSENVETEKPAMAGFPEVNGKHRGKRGQKSVKNGVPKRKK